MDNFKDHFSANSEKYGKYRPEYPSRLFKFLSTITPEHELAWDCATGSGQAALGLVRYFNKVIATDASERQIKSAIRHEKISYKVAPAHKAPIQTESIDLITVAQALHWFEFDPFYKEVNRVLKKDGIVAVWTYNLLSISREIDAIIQHFYSDTVGEFWPPERKLVENGYETVPFPFHKLPGPSFRMSAKWTVRQLLGYLSTWSAVKRYRENKGMDPVQSLEKELTETWNNGSNIREVRWPLSVIIGKKTDMWH